MANPKRRNKSIKSLLLTCRSWSRFLSHYQSTFDPCFLFFSLPENFRSHWRQQTCLLVCVCVCVFVCARARVDVCDGVLLGVCM